MRYKDILIRHIGVFLLLMVTGISSILSAQEDSELTLQQYLFPAFSKTKVLLKNGSSQTVMMNYNMVTEKMVYEQDGKKFDLINTGTVDTVYLHDRKFIPYGKVFHELILKGEPLTLFIRQQASLQSAGTPAGYGGTSQLAATKRLSSIEISSGRYNLPLSKDYIVDYSPIYLIRRGDELLDFYSEKQLFKLLSDREKDLKDFSKKNRIKIENVVQLAEMIDYYNNLVR